ncbi:MAG: hypothetical protein D6791_16645 [Chloroflexi bacterium]|nr:MAG: hypothetical protein D6791_16645 [Chloroflexota bacterium]
MQIRLRQSLRFLAEELLYLAVCAEYRALDGWQAPRQKVLVNSSPKTGTTWVVRLLSSLPGYRRIGNFQGDLSRYHTVLPGDVVHGHDWYTPELGAILRSNHIKVIVTLRDPRDQTVSRMFHLRRDPNTPWYEKMNSLDDYEALMACIEGRPGLPSALDRIKLTQSWLQSDADVLCVRYEDMVADTAAILKQMLVFLGIRAQDRLVQAIVTRNRFERLTIGRRIWRPARQPGQENGGSHFRKGIVGDWKNYFHEAHVERFKQVAGEALIELGYERDLDW